MTTPAITPDFVSYDDWLAAMKVANNSSRVHGFGYPKITVSVSELAFPLTDPGQLSAAQSVTFSNSGQGVLVVFAYVEGEFTFVTTPSNPYHLAHGESVTLSLKYSPLARGYRIGVLKIISNAINGIWEREVKLTGSSRPPAGVPAPNLVLPPGLSTQVCS